MRIDVVVSIQFCIRILSSGSEVLPMHDWKKQDKEII